MTTTDLITLFREQDRYLKFGEFLQNGIIWEEVDEYRDEVQIYEREGERGRSHDSTVRQTELAGILD